MLWGSGKFRCCRQFDNEFRTTKSGDFRLAFRGRELEICDIRLAQPSHRNACEHRYHDDDCYKPVYVRLDVDMNRVKEKHHPDYSYETANDLIDL